MSKKLFANAMAVLATIIVPAVANPVQAQGTGATVTGHYSVETTPIGTLLDDPAASAILQRLIPTVFANEMFQTMGRPQTLRAVQQFEGAVLTDSKLAEIQAEFDKLPPRQ